MTVNKATPAIDPQSGVYAYVYGETLDSKAIAESASVAGTFEFVTPGAKPNAGTTIAEVKFTPDDTANYEIVYFDLEISVAKAEPTWTQSGTYEYIYGEALGTKSLIGESASVAGTFYFLTPTDKPNAGTTTAAIKFIPSDTVNYEVMYFDLDITVSEAEGYGEVHAFDWVYGDTPVAPVITNPNGVGITIEYDDGSDTWTVIPVTAIAGNYTVRVIFAATANYGEYIAYATFKIVQAEGNGNFTIDGWVYGETPNDPVVDNPNSADGVTYTVEYRAKGSSSWLPWSTVSKSLGAGDYEIRVTFSESTNYEEFVLEGTFTVTKANGYGEVSISSIVFGDKLNPVVVNPNGVSYTIQYSSDGVVWNTTAPTAVGTYAIRVVFNGTSNYKVFVTNPKTFEIVKAEIVFSFTVSGWTYGETPKPVLVNDPSNTGYKVEYRLKGSLAWLDWSTVSSSLAVGTYQIQVISNAGITLTGEFIVSKAFGYGTVDAFDWVEGNPPASPYVYVYNPNGVGYVVEYSLDGNTWSLVLPTAAGRYTVRVTFNETESYGKYEACANFEIIEADDPANFTIEGWTYGDEPNEPDIYNPSGLGYEVQYCVAGSGAWLDFSTVDSSLAAGQYDIQIIFNAGNVDEFILNGTFTVAQANGSGSVSISSWKYGGTASAANITNPNQVATVTEYSSNGVNWSTSVPTAVGNYWIRVTFDGSGNYKAHTEYATFSITKGNGSVSITITGWKADETANKPTVSITAGDYNLASGVIEYSKDGGKTWSAAVPTEAGNYIVRVTFGATANYEGTTATANFTIEPETVIFPPDHTGEILILVACVTLACIGAAVLLILIAKKRRKSQG